MFLAYLVILLKVSRMLELIKAQVYWWNVDCWTPLGLNMVFVMDKPD